jgi:ribosome assembly protein YihI (activator of Der GTPase)
MSEATDPVNVIYKFKRTMQEQLDALVQTLANGGIDNMSEYKYIIGKIHAIDLMNQELSTKEPKNDDPDNITRIRR